MSSKNNDLKFEKEKLEHLNKQLSHQKESSVSQEVDNLKSQIFNKTQELNQIKELVDTKDNKIKQLENNITTTRASILTLQREVYDLVEDVNIEQYHILIIVFIHFKLQKIYFYFEKKPQPYARAQRSRSRWNSHFNGL